MEMDSIVYLITTCRLPKEGGALFILDLTQTRVTKNLWFCLTNPSDNPPNISDNPQNLRISIQHFWKDLIWLKDLGGWSILWLFKTKNKISKKFKFKYWIDNSPYLSYSHSNFKQALCAVKNVLLKKNLGVFCKMN